jgi:hypothetical protein
VFVADIQGAIGPGIPDGREKWSGSLLQELQWSKTGPVQLEARA